MGTDLKTKTWVHNKHHHFFLKMNLLNLVLNSLIFVNLGECRRIKNLFSKLEQIEDLSELSDSGLRLLLKHPDVKNLLADLPKVENIKGRRRKLGIPSDEYKRIRRPVTLDRLRRYHEDTQKKFDLETTLLLAKLKNLQKVTGGSGRNFNPNEHLVVNSHIRNARDQSKAECQKRNARNRGRKFNCETTLTADEIRNQYRRKGNKRFNPLMSKQAKKVKGGRYGNKKMGFKSGTSRTNSSVRYGNRRMKMKSKGRVFRG